MPGSQQLEATEKCPDHACFTLVRDQQLGGEFPFVGYVMILKCLCDGSQLSSVVHCSIKELPTG